MVTSNGQDWRSKCEVVQRPNGSWDVVTENGKYWLAFVPAPSWVVRSGMFDNIGSFGSESHARQILALAPMPPDVAASQVADAIGRGTDEKGTARLAADLSMDDILGQIGTIADQAQRTWAATKARWDSGEVVRQATAPKAKAKEYGEHTEIVTIEVEVEVTFDAAWDKYDKDTNTGGCMELTRIVTAEVVGDLKEHVEAAIEAKLAEMEEPSND